MTVRTLQAACSHLTGSGLGVSGQGPCPSACADGSPSAVNGFGHPCKRPFACALLICRTGATKEGAIDLMRVSRSVFDRKFRIKAAQSSHSDRYCSGKRPLCSGKLERTQGGNPRRQKLARQRWAGSGAYTEAGGQEATPTAWLRQAALWHIRQRL